jgi:hypothetical protein
MQLDCACNGSFNSTDTQDYYSLNQYGTTNVRLWLRNLPSGSNFGAAIYEDQGATHNYVCHIGTPGSGDKYVDCSGLSGGGNYYVLVDAGGSPGSTQTYQVSVESR